MFNDKVILITGGTGSFGRRFVERILSDYNPRKVIVFSRDEMKQWDMSHLFKGEDRLRFFLGDVRDKERLIRAFAGVDYVVHAAATKIVPLAEYNPFECVKTNIIGAMNVVDAAITAGVEKVVALSTDKASAPINLYGGTKLVSDKIFISGNNYAAQSKTSFSVVRYGNVMGSRGSVIPLFLGIREANELPITDMNMTRFMLTLDQGIDLVIHAFEEMFGGELFVKKIPSMKIVDIARCINPNAILKEIGMFPGEKLHEQMISKDEARYTYEYQTFYKILPQLNNWHLDPARIGDGSPVGDSFEYTSNGNVEWMSRSELTVWIEDNIDKFVKI